VTEAKSERIRAGMRAGQSDVDPELLATGVRAWRLKRSWSQGELARAANVSETTVVRLEGGDPKRLKKRPYRTTLRKVADAFGVEVDDLVNPPGSALASTGEPDPKAQPLNAHLRAELRGARRALRKSYDFLREDPNIAFRALDRRDTVLQEVEREIRGT
jgi:transcriptional regulator with XRE-family HTH domain